MRWLIAFIVFWGVYDSGAMVFMFPKEEKPNPDKVGETRNPKPEIRINSDSPPCPQTSQETQTRPREADDFYSLSPADLQKIGDYVQSMPGIEDRRITTALNSLESGLPSNSQQDCSQGVRKAIMAERGIDIFRGANSREVNTVNGREAATCYGLDRMLRRNGYELIASGAGYVPKRGDVQSISYGKVINGYGGHVQYFDGTDWISDHKQRGSATDLEALRAEGIDPSKVMTWTYRRNSKSF